MRGQVKAVQRSVGASFDSSADSHERTAKSYERVADHREPRDEYPAHTGRHPEFARDDHWIAQQLPQMAESDSPRNPPVSY